MILISGSISTHSSGNKVGVCFRIFVILYSDTVRFHSVNVTVCLFLKGKNRVKGYRFYHPSLSQLAAQRPKFRKMVKSVCF